MSYFGPFSVFHELKLISMIFLIWKKYKKKITKWLFYIDFTIVGPNWGILFFIGPSKNIKIRKRNTSKFENFDIFYFWPSPLKPLKNLTQASDKCFINFFVKSILELTRIKQKISKNANIINYDCLHSTEKTNKTKNISESAAHRKKFFLLNLCFKIRMQFNFIYKYWDLRL